MYKLIPVKRLYKDFYYDEDRKTLVWRTGPMKGQAAGTVNGNGYVVVDWLGSKWYLHRLVFAYYNDKDINTLVIDHMDFCRTNNDITNLRAVSFRENIIRCRNSSRQTLSYRGIEKRNTLKKGVLFRASLMVNGVRHRTKWYKDMRKAYNKYLQLFAKLNGVENMSPTLLNDYLKK